jgi:hypothetical protein
MTPNLRLYKKRAVEDTVDELSLENEPELDRLISFMQNAIINTESDRDRIATTMTKTFEIRRAWIKQPRSLISLRDIPSLNKCQTW